MSSFKKFLINTRRFLPKKLTDSLSYFEVMSGSRSFVLGVLAWRMGRFDKAAHLLERFVQELGIVRQGRLARPLGMRQQAALCSVFSLIVRSRLALGDIDGAMITYVKACRIFGMDQLPGIDGVDSKTAQVMRAAVAAARLLEDGDSATLVVKVSRRQDEDGAVRRKLSLHKGGIDNGLGTRELPEIRKLSTKSLKSAKIIPFPIIEPS